MKSLGISTWDKFVRGGIEIDGLTPREFGSARSFALTGIEIASRAPAKNKVGSHWEKMYMVQA